ncbi:unnamed protein product, partial [Polarella glacialis]
FGWVTDLVGPCFDCDGPCPADREDRPARTSKRTSLHGRNRLPRHLQPRLSKHEQWQKQFPDLFPDAGTVHRVDLVVSPLAGLRGAAGYHTSVLVAGEEYYFSPTGIRCCPRLMSHGKVSGVRRIKIGKSQLSGIDLLERLTEYFQPATYDLLKKNCNNFTDCALVFLMGRRLDESFRSIEMVGLAVDQSLGLLQALSGGRYMPNDKAEGYDHEAVIEELLLERELEFGEGSELSAEDIGHAVEDDGCHRDNEMCRDLIDDPSCW